MSQNQWTAKFDEIFKDMEKDSYYLSTCVVINQMFFESGSIFKKSDSIAGIPIRFLEAKMLHGKGCEIVGLTKLQRKKYELN